MSAPNAKNGEPDGVHRLVDMVVEEVSLVDRAANKHRFLIVKRDDSMDETNPTQAQAEAEAAPDHTEDAALPETATEDVGAEKALDSPALETAVAALESLTAIVELLGSLGADQSDPRLGALAQQLRETAEQLLATDPAVDQNQESGDATENAKAEGQQQEPEEPPSKTGAFAADVDAAKTALARLSQLVSGAISAPDARVKGTLAVEPAPAVLEGLEKLTESFRSLSESVKEQQQRLGRVEKHFGLPNSAAPAEHLTKAAPQDVGWPLDLNKPKDRENVDKAVSFHDP